MRLCFCAILLVIFSSFGLAEEPIVVVNRAIDAIGGEKVVKELKAGTWKTNGTANGNPSQADFHGELPGKFRIDSQRTVDGKKVLFSRVVNGDKGWVILGDKVTPMTEAEIAAVRASYYHKQMASTLLPLKDPAMKLTMLGNVEINGTKTVGIQATREGYPDVLLYFDAKTTHLVKTEMNEENPVSKKARKVELFLSDYKEFDGMKMASKTKTYHDGKLFLDTELVEFHRAGQLPAKMFDAP
jgi:hypothetical protein